MVLAVGVVSGKDSMRVDGTNGGVRAPLLIAQIDDATPKRKAYSLHRSTRIDLPVTSEVVAA
jgi:hypothetical protein